MLGVERHCCTIVLLYQNKKTIFNHGVEQCIAQLKISHIYDKMKVYGTHVVVRMLNSSLQLGNLKCSEVKEDNV